MKLLHLSDLHLGKRVHEVSMIEDQDYILRKILEIVDQEEPDGVLIAGDVYDKGVAPEEAVELFDWFLNSLSKRNLKVFVISGNHDSARRISFGASLMEKSGVYFSQAYDRQSDYLSKSENESEGANACGESGIVLKGKDGVEAEIYLLPFIKPLNVRSRFPDEECVSYTDAVRIALSHMVPSESSRARVLVAHQFVTGADRCDSEEVSVGGVDNVDSSAFDGFDYVALGHLHGPQSVGRKEVRYSGTPLKYSFSEVDHEKSVTVVEIDGDKKVEIRTVPLVPKRDMRELRGKYDELMLKENYEGTNTQDYLHVILTDEDEIPNGLGKLRTVYPNILHMEYDNIRSRKNSVVSGSRDVTKINPLEIFGQLYELQNNQKMTPEQEDVARELIEGIWGKN